MRTIEQSPIHIYSFTKYFEKFAEQTKENKKLNQIKLLEITNRMYNEAVVGNCVICLDSLNTKNCFTNCLQCINSSAVNRLQLPIQLNNCNHVFHVGCIEKWGEQSNKCPLCNVKIYDTIDEKKWIVDNILY